MLNYIDFSLDDELFLRVSNACAEGWGAHQDIYQQGHSQNCVTQSR